jgi:hypothetical protein
MSLTGLKKHIRILEETGLVTTEKTGRARECRLGPGELKDAVSSIEAHRRRVIVPEDCCESVSDEWQAFSMTQILPLIGSVVTADEFNGGPAPVARRASARLAAPSGLRGDTFRARRFPRNRGVTRRLPVCRRNFAVEVQLS